MGINTQGNAPSKLKMPKMGKVIDRGLYYGLQFAKNKESKRYHNILRDIAMAQMGAEKDNLAFQKHQGDIQNAQQLLQIQNNNHIQQGELNLKQREQLMKMYQVAKKNGLDTSQLEKSLTEGANVDTTKMGNTNEWNETFGTWRANNKEGGGATPSNQTVGDNTNPQPDNPNDNKEPFNDVDTPDDDNTPPDADKVPVGSGNPNQPMGGSGGANTPLETQENNALYNWYNKTFHKNAHSKDYYHNATNELQGKNADLNDTLNSTQQALEEQKAGRVQDKENYENLRAQDKEAYDKLAQENELNKKDADINFKQNLDATKYGMEQENKVNQLAEDNANKDKEIAYHQNMADVNKSALEDANNQAQKEVQEKRNIQSQLDSSNLQNQNLQEENANKQKEADYYANQSNVNESALRDSQVQNQKQAEENRKLKGAIDTMHNMDEAHKQQASDVINSKDAKIDELNKQAEQTKEDSQRAWDFNKQVVNGLTDERNNLSNQNKSLQSDKENLTNENQSLKSDNENVNKQLQDKDQYIKDHDAYMFDREQKHDQENAKNLEIAKDETARAQAQTANQKSKYERRVGNLTDENNKLRNSNRNLKSESEKVNEDNKIKDRLLGNQNANNVKLERSNKNLSTRNANERKQHQSELENQKANYEGQLKDRDNTIANQTNELNNTKAQMDKQTKDYAKDIQASKGETSRAQFKLGQANAKNEKLTAQNKQLSGDNAKLHSFFKGLSKIGKKGSGNK